MLSHWVKIINVGQIHRGITYNFGRLPPLAEDRWSEPGQRRTVRARPPKGISPRRSSWVNLVDQIKSSPGCRVADHSPGRCLCKSHVSKMFCAEDSSLRRGVQVGANRRGRADEDRAFQGGRVPWGDLAGCACQSHFLATLQSLGRPTAPPARAFDWSPHIPSQK